MDRRPPKASASTPPPPTPAPTSTAAPTPAPKPPEPPPHTQTAQPHLPPSLPHSTAAGNPFWDAIRQLGSDLSLTDLRFIHCLGVGDIGTVYLSEIKRSTSSSFAASLLSTDLLKSAADMLKSTTDLLKSVFALLNQPSIC